VSSGHTLLKMVANQTTQHWRVSTPLAADDLADVDHALSQHVTHNKADPDFERKRREFKKLHTHTTNQQSPPPTITKDLIKDYSLVRTFE